MAEILIANVPGCPPIKNEALSLFSERHGQWSEVRELLAAAKSAIAAASWDVRDASSSLGLELTLRSAQPPLGDATNYLGGVGDVLEVKSRRGALLELADLADVALYANDKSLHEIHYRWVPTSAANYSIRVWDRVDT